MPIEIGLWKMGGQLEPVRFQPLENDKKLEAALVGKHVEYEMVLTNPPFGKKSSVTTVNEVSDEEKQSLVVHRDDFWASTSKCEPHRHYSSTSSQHVFTILKQHGRAAVEHPTDTVHIAVREAFESPIETAENRGEKHVDRWPQAVIAARNALVQRVVLQQADPQQP